MTREELFEKLKTNSISFLSDEGVVLGPTKMVMVEDISKSPNFGPAQVLHAAMIDYLKETGEVENYCSFYDKFSVDGWIALPRIVEEARWDEISFVKLAKKDLLSVTYPFISIWTQMMLGFPIISEEKKEIVAFESASFLDELWANLVSHYEEKFLELELIQLQTPVTLEATPE